ncbi:hypothetical protein QBC44DRAFT_324593 [Cladorrhinum sp. PSN332]|nr:hypothetical protein QBC44DRAFT_324593 [Cladorrhinum sp. PSN332]
MADHQDHTSMYCHACHRTWERDGSSIECPQCSSSSTEMVRDPSYRDDFNYQVEFTVTTALLTFNQITPEHDPRLFHNSQQEEPVTTAMDTTATPMDTTATPMDTTSATLDTTPSTPNPQTTSEQGQQPSPPHRPDEAATPNGNTNDNNRPQGPQPIRFTAVSFPGGVTLFTTVVGDQPPPQLMPGPVPIPFFGWQFMHPTRHTHSPAEADRTSQAQGEGHRTDTQQQQQETQQPQPQEQPAAAQPAPTDSQPPRQAQMIEAILAMLFNPAAAIMGDAVYSQEAYDRVMTMLRNQAPVGGAPPASQAAIEKLVVKELDEGMLGGDGTSKCVVCVEDMAKGEKATVLPCSHFFHGECVTPWLKEHNTCPVCRRSIEQEDPVKNKAAVFGPERPPTMGPHEHQDNSMDCS